MLPSPQACTKTRIRQLTCPQVLARMSPQGIAIMSFVPCYLIPARLKTAARHREVGLPPPQLRVPRLPHVSRPRLPPPPPPPPPFLVRNLLLHNRQEAEAAIRGVSGHGSGRAVRLSVAVTDVADGASCCAVNDALASLHALDGTLAGCPSACALEFGSFGSAGRIGA
eukprot:scaffold209810_cov28-Tisochrysis_lutea.AAC.2